MPRAPVKNSYQDLLGLLREEMEQARMQIERFVHHQRIVTNWNIGRRLGRYLSANRREYVSETQLVKRLAGDLDVNRRYLQLTVQFYRAYPELPAAGFLNWSHYRALLRIKDPAERRDWERRIRTERLTGKCLEYSILSGQVDTGAKISDKPAKLAVERGQLYTYKLVKSPAVHHSEAPLMVDCGFEVRVEQPPGDFDSALSGTLVRSDKIEEGYKLAIVHHPVEMLYTYVALIERVVDGDTLVVLIDCGFGIWIRQRLRLRSIDAPEINTINGQKAKQFLLDELKEVPFAVIKTYGSDKYDRYLVDVFYSAGEPDPFKAAAEGRLLNQVLLEEGLAKRY